jgi:hypothetical protein
MLSGFFAPPKNKAAVKGFFWVDGLMTPGATQPLTAKTTQPFPHHWWSFTGVGGGLFFEMPLLQTL